MNNLNNIKKFNDLYNTPKCVKGQMSTQLNSPEHPYYHPEGTLGKHIDIVLERAFLTECKELHFAAYFHDITKGGYCKELWGDEKKGRLKGVYYTQNGCVRTASVNTDNEDNYLYGDYWQNVNHHNQAGDYMKLHREWIESCGVDFEVAYRIVRLHMKMKQYLPAKKGIPHKMKPSKMALFEKENRDIMQLLWYFSNYCDNMRF